MKKITPIAAVALLATLLGAASSATGSPTEPVQFHISEPHLDAALNAWARQTGYSLLVPIVSESEGPVAQEITGTYTAQQALDILLARSDLTYEFVNSRTVAIRLADAVRADSNRAATQVDTRSTASPSKVLEESNEDSKQNHVGPFSTRGMPEVLVTGTKSLDTDIRRTRDDTQPYIVIDRAIIEQSGATNLNQLLSTQLTMATSAASPAQQSGVFGNTSSINLRGLGSDETLILIDGRRAAGYGPSNAPQQPDLNGIPLAAIERIEVLPATASGIYGGGATGGVVNVILRRDYAGLETKATYGNAFDTGGAVRNAELTGGFNLENGRTNVLLSASWSDAGALLTQDRDFELRARTHIIATNPSAIFGGAVPPLGATTNIRSTTGANLTLKSDGRSLGSPFTSVPYHYAGPSSDGGAALLANAGRYNLDLSNTATAQGVTLGDGGRLSLLNAPTTKTAMATIRRSFTPGLDAFLESSVSQNLGTFGRSPTFSSMTIPASAAANPFNQAIGIVTPSIGVSQNIQSELKSQRVAGGVILRLPQSWSVGTDYTWNRTISSGTQVASTNATGATTAVANGSLKVFADTNDFPVNFTPFVLSPGSLSPAHTTLKDATIRASGNMPISLPGGHPSVSVMLEHRDQSIDDEVTVTESRTPGNFTRILFPGASQAVDSAYVETTIPIASPDLHIAGLQLLELQLSGRKDRYRTDGVNSVAVDANLNPLTPVTRTRSRLDSTDPTFGLRYRPLEDVTVRASYGTGFLPPSVSQLVPAAPFPVPPLGLTDPLRNNEPVGSWTFVGGGNPNLLPEKSESRSAGLVITPRAISGMRISADWIEIKKRDNISSPNPLTQSGLNNLIEFAPDRITRGPSSGSTVGPITAIDATLINLARLKMTAYDFAVDWQVDTESLGLFAIRLGATRLTSLQTQQTEAAQVVEYAGVGSAGNVSDAADGGGLKWRGNGTVTWSHRGMTLGWTAHYFDSYFLNSDHSVVPNQGSATVPSQVYHDFFGSYQPQRAPWGINWLGSTMFQFGVNNVLNKAPPVDVVGRSSLSPGYSLYGDPRLANYYVSVRISFGSHK